MLYAYILLCIGCYASYEGASALSIVIIGTLLTIRNVMTLDGQTARTIETVAHSVNALIFAGVAFVVGRGIALILGA